MFNTDFDYRVNTQLYHDENGFQKAYVQDMEGRDLTGEVIGIHLKVTNGFVSQTLVEFENDPFPTMLEQDKT